MKYLSKYKIFEASKSLVDGYLTKMGTTRQEVIDVFQGIIDLGYEPKFKMTFLDKDGIGRAEKSSGQETPILLISFKTDSTRYIGGSQRFKNIDYLENLYHSLAMFMSMFKDECNIEYDINNYVELELRCQFDTEYDETKVALSKDEISDALESCLSLVPAEYTSDISVERKTVTLKVNPENSVGQRLLDQLKASKTDKNVSNYDETEKMGLDIIKELEKVLSEKFKKDIRYVRGISFYNGTGLFLFNGDKQDQMIAKVRINNWANTKTYKADIKRGFLKIDKCLIELESLEIEIQLP